MILIVNTAEEALQLVLAEIGQNPMVLDSFEQPCAGRMNEVMAPAAAAMLKSGGELTAVACVRGPGSFTGVRLGLAFATGLCLGRGLPMAGIDYFPALAAGVHAPDAGEIHVLTHSRNNKVYHQAFAPASRPEGLPVLPDPLGPPLDLEVPLAREIIRERAACSQVVLIGSGLRRNPGAFAQIPGVTPLSIENPTPEALLAAAIAASFDGPPVEALYLRGSDAEENLAAIASGRGLTEEEALLRMAKAMR
jgi:tRNA threonylcarbamoyl adenosine modification protein YeaZ